MHLKAEGHEQYMPSANKPGPQSMLMFSNFDEVRQWPVLTLPD